MNEEELEKTKPIEVLSDLSRSQKYKDTPEETREEKYQDALENDIEEIKKDNEESEKAEEALAEKNIAEAEAILEEESNIVTPDVIVKDKKENVFKKLKNKWNNLSKKKKILIIVIGILILVLIGILIYNLVKKEDKKEVIEKKEDIVLEAPVIIDNFYFRDGKLYFTDDKEEVLGNYECENKDSNLCYVAFNSNRDQFDVSILQDEAGNELKQRLDVYEDRFVFIIDNKEENDHTIKLFSMTDGKLVGTYKSVKAYSDNYIIVEDTSSNYGLLKIDDGVNEIISPQYEYLGMIDKTEKLIAKNKKGYVVVDMSNKILSSPLPSNVEVKSYNDKMLVVTINGEYNVYDYKANLIASGYTFALVKDEYIGLVDSNKKLYVRKMDKTKLNEGDITLATDYYVVTYIYGKDGNIKKIKRSFDLNVKDSVLEVAIYDKSGDASYENIEYIYSQANKKYPYVNYFAGKLYFYKDIEKEELLGSYTCSNKNYVENEADEYKSCFVAKDTIYDDNDTMSLEDVNRKGIAPIINNTYVFISDGSNNVKLYDLVQNKSLGNYSGINTYSNVNEVSHFEGSKVVIGKNKKDKFGMLAFDSNGVTAKYTFDYYGIEKVGKYYELSEDGEYWYLKLENDTNSAKFNGKIMGYSIDMKYFKIYKNGKYSIANQDGKVEISETYKYVELYSKFYAGVDDKNNIYVYDYTGKKLSNDAAKASSYPFSKGAEKAIKISVEGSNYVVSVYNGSTYDEYVLKEASNEKDEDKETGSGTKDNDNKDNEGSGEEKVD